MNPASRRGTGLVPTSPSNPSLFVASSPKLSRAPARRRCLRREEFFFGRIRNEHTRAAYLVAIKRFFGCAERRGLELHRVAPADIGHYFDELRNGNTSIATRKQHLAALRHYFDGLVTR